VLYVFCPTTNPNAKTAPEKEKIKTPF